MVFVGNINQSVESLVKTSHLLAPFPDVMIDSAFFYCFHVTLLGNSKNAPAVSYQPIWFDC